MSVPADQLAKKLALVALAAGREIMAVYRQGCDVSLKENGSPVTIADRNAEQIIWNALQAQFPEIPIIAEEAGVPQGAEQAADAFFLVDALDGTAEFISQRPEFTVNIALIKNGSPFAGCVFSPASGEMYLGGTSAFSGKIKTDGRTLPPLHRIEARPRPRKMIAAISRTHLDEETSRFLATQAIEATLGVGSSIKFCRIAEGLADIYPRFGATMEWDTAAGHAVLNAAGGTILAPDGSPLVYGKANSGFTNGPFIAWGK